MYFISFVLFCQEKYGYFPYFFTQVRGDNIIIIGKISSLPKSIAKENIIFENPLYSAKEDIPPKNGPILFTHDTVAVKLASNPNESKLTSKNTANVQIMYIAR